MLRRRLEAEVHSHRGREGMGVISPRGDRQVNRHVEQSTELCAKRHVDTGEGAVNYHTGKEDGHLREQEPL